MHRRNDIIEYLSGCWDLIIRSLVWAMRRTKWSKSIISGARSPSNCILKVHRRNRPHLWLCLNVLFMLPVLAYKMKAQQLDARSRKQFSDESRTGEKTSRINVCISFGVLFSDDQKWICENEVVRVGDFQRRNPEQPFSPRLWKLFQDTGLDW